MKVGTSILFVLLSNFAWVQTGFSSLLSDPLMDSVKNKVKSFPKKGQIAVGLFRNDTIQYVGFENDEKELKRIKNEEAIFEIGSITKLFTIGLLCDLVYHEEVTVNEKVKKYLPFKQLKGITFEQLANHTSGLPRIPENIYETITDLSRPYNNYTEKDFTQYLQSELEFLTKPGAKNNYSNLGIGILAMALQKIEGKSYKELLNEKIIQKFNLTNTSLDDLQDNPDFVFAYNRKGEIIPVWKWASPMIAAGGLKSTVVDLLKFAKEHLNFENEMLQLGLKPTFSFDSSMDIGLGWHILIQKSGKRLYWHNGRSGGYTSSIILSIEEKTAAVILSNQAEMYLDDLVINLINSL